MVGSDNGYCPNMWHNLRTFFACFRWISMGNIEVFKGCSVSMLEGVTDHINPLGGGWFLFVEGGPLIKIEYDCEIRNLAGAFDNFISGVCDKQGLECKL
ncbi:hypothetical protein CDAR_10341 [Caerostris darwini]|uniref:Uncharacterized protein n=1 Tax=Caerostris darwini TaxID=1538125 RepID=A0AAV4RW61_9ARAC|nr:hypothetical protein CDAR_10341 [Caerostris darwini]